MEQLHHELLHLDPADVGRLPEAVHGGIVQDDLDQVGGIVLRSQPSVHLRVF